MRTLKRGAASGASRSKPRLLDSPSSGLTPPVMLRGVRVRLRLGVLQTIEVVGFLLVPAVWTVAVESVDGEFNCLTERAARSGEAKRPGWRRTGVRRGIGEDVGGKRGRD